MRTELLDSVSESFVTAVPLIKKNLFRSFSIDHVPFQLSRSNLEALFSLNELRSASVSQLCNHLGISPPNMTPLIDKLVLNGLANRMTTEEAGQVGGTIGGAMVREMIRLAQEKLSRRE